ncbi:MAG: glycosyltransferase family 4 protein [Thiobacillus sp.]|uniref:glycosyltransferase family 4 protein n=1 Tax=Thiobacillus sp. TaxID=924 RepID=UPI0027356BDB|nr:glycosyltransferase family 4 protein [Thiobacillus sp.]MDP3584445.1 glycosyltransferase family 4 protein [Thiobacillus sp.]
MTPPVILVASLLPEHGYCGVQTHARAVSGFARSQGYEVRLVEPHQVNRWIRRLPSLVTRMLRRLDPEKAVLWHRALAFRYLRFRLRKSLRELEGRPVVIYAQDPLSARAALALRHEGFDFRVIAVLHFNISEAYEHQLNGQTREGGALWRSLMRIEQAVLPQLDKLIFVSDYMRRIVLARNPALANVDVAVIPNFPEHAVERAAKDQPLRADIISIGTLEPRKNQGYLLQVLAEAKRLGYRYRLTLAGDGPSRPEWEALAKQLGVADQVEFLGYVAGASSLLPAHRVYAHAAQMENLPLTLIEALACGLPVFAPAVGGIPEVFDDGVDGIAWLLNDATACAEKLIEILEDPRMWERMSKAARQSYQVRFSPDVLGPQWVSAITTDLSSVESERATSATMEMKTT